MTETIHSSETCIMMRGLGVLNESPHHLLLDTLPDDLEGQRSQAAERHEDPELASWLRLYGADQDAVDRVGLCFTHFYPFISN